ncbi:hypothetical protein [uncultured Prevotella sp.]|uniref:hypothetical protein n=1 Tax=uncultured Prevotella sp. TaxID=159272 RepID=UPI00261492F4|nr:hypothetical protein [uncultured Prevotella sp.]
MTKHLRTMTVAMLLTACSIVSNATEANTFNQVTNASEQNVINADDNKTQKCVEFVAGTDNGSTGTLGGASKADEISKDGVKVHCSRASFKNNPYRFNGSSTTTISTEKGNIVKIEIVGDGLKKLVKNGEGEYNITNDLIVWTGSAKSVSFKNKKTLAEYAAATNIRVYVELPGTTTGIGSVNVDKHNNANNAVYNLQGQRVDGKSLPKGIYIKNGKKFMVK